MPPGSYAALTWTNVIRDSARLHTPSFGSAGAGLCGETCRYASNGICDDGGPGAKYGDCALGTAFG
eukprot:3025882-Prymnesium_polylepis.1